MLRTGSICDLLIHENDAMQKHFLHILPFSIWDRLVKIAKVQNSGNFWRRLSLENGLFSLGKQFHGDWRGHLHQISQLDFIKLKHGCISYIKMQNPICSWMFQMCFCVLDLVKMHHPSIHPSTHPSVFCEKKQNGKFFQLAASAKNNQISKKAGTAGRRLNKNIQIHLEINTSRNKYKYILY